MSQGLRASDRDREEEKDVEKEEEETEAEEPTEPTEEEKEEEIGVLSPRQRERRGARIDPAEVLEPPDLPPSPPVLSTIEDVLAWMEAESYEYRGEIDGSCCRRLIQLTRAHLAQMA